MTELNTSLLHDFLSSGCDLFALAEKHALSLEQLIAWWKSESTQASVKALEEIANARTTLLAKLHAPAAMECLADIVESPSGASPIERRRAAAVILRHAGTPKPERVHKAVSPDAASPPGAPVLSRLDFIPGAHANGHATSRHARRDTPAPRRHRPRP